MTRRPLAPDPATRNAIRMIALSIRLRRYPVLPDLLSRLADWIDPLPPTE